MRTPPASPWLWLSICASILSTITSTLSGAPTWDLQQTTQFPKTCKPPPQREIVCSSVCVFVAPAVCHRQPDWASVTSVVWPPVLTLEEVMTNAPTQVRFRQEATRAFLCFLLLLKRRGTRGGGRQEKKRREVVMGTDTENPVCEEAWDKMTELQSDWMRNSSIFHRKKER